MSDPRLVRAIRGEPQARPPVWFMRQAGRILPEYRALRAEAGSFMNLAYNPKMAAEVSLQPTRRFPMDAAIIFADILLLPDALGQKVWFEAGEGPRLGDMPSIEAMQEKVETANEHLACIGETVSRVRAELEPDRAVIGFAGGPWTVATYMLKGRGGDREEARRYAFAQPEELDRLLTVLVEATARYMAMQVQAGAQALQIFESWAELLPEDVFERLVTRPHAAIVRRLRELGVAVPVIGFPRGAASLADEYAAGAGVDVVGLDVTASAALGRRLQQTVAIQGALDPLLLRAGGPALDARIDRLIEQWGGGRYIFNLGHGVLPDTPIENVARAVARVTGR
jgi:uroporphyrinogen decarboxylase